jgi:hypothetical protein
MPPSTLGSQLLHTQNSLIIFSLPQNSREICCFAHQFNVYCLVLNNTTQGDSNGSSQTCKIMLYNEMQALQNVLHGRYCVLWGKRLVDVLKFSYVWKIRMLDRHVTTSRGCMKNDVRINSLNKTWNEGDAKAQNAK